MGMMREARSKERWDADEVALYVGVDVFELGRMQHERRRTGFPSCLPNGKWDAAQVQQWYALKVEKSTSPEAFFASPPIIYFVRCQDFVKVGEARDTQARLSGLQVGCPYELELIGTIRGRFETEFSIHDTLAPYRVRGEWFRWCDEVRLAIAAYLAVDGCDG